MACFAQLQEWGGTKFVPPIKKIFFSDSNEIWTRNVFQCEKFCCVVNFSKFQRGRGQNGGQRSILVRVLPVQNGQKLMSTDLYEICTRNVNWCYKFKNNVIFATFWPPRVIFGVKSQFWFYMKIRNFYDFTKIALKKT